MPSFTTMLTLATWKIVGDECPLLSTNLFYETHKSSVLIWRPHLLFVGTKSSIWDLGSIVVSIILFIGGHLRSVLAIHMWMIHTHIIDTATHGNGFGTALVSHCAWHHVWLLLVNWLSLLVHLLILLFFIFVIEWFSHFKLKVTLQNPLFKIFIPIF